MDFRSIADEVYNFEPRADDVWIMTHPRSGTTWTQETVWQILQGVDPDSSRTGSHLYTRSPYLEMTALVPEEERSKDYFKVKKNPDRKEMLCIQTFD